MRAPLLALVLAVAVVGCGGTDAEDPASLAVAGRVVDFVTGAPVGGTASVTVRGLAPAPVVVVDGDGFSAEPIAAHSVFHLIAAAPPSHRATYVEVTVTDASLPALEVPAVAEAYLAGLGTVFGLAPTAARGVLFARAVDDTGAPRAGVPAAAFTVPPGARGPYFLDAQLQAAPGATATTASGWVVFFELEPGLIGLTAAAGAEVTMEMATSPVAPAAATVARVVVRDGAAALPRDVSFATQVRPIFERRGCETCHSGSGPGRDLGNLTLDGSTQLIYRELVEEAALVAGPKRVDLAAPERSLLLTMPSAEDPPDGHPNITFTGPGDRDYQLILVWIREGAREN